MDINEYQAWVRDSWSGRPLEEQGNLRDLFIMCTGLAGEVGEVLEPIKKEIRDGKLVDAQDLTLELGDVLYYLTRIALYYGVELREVVEANRRKLDHRAVRDARLEKLGRALAELVGEQRAANIPVLVRGDERCGPGHMFVTATYHGEYARVHTHVDDLEGWRSAVGFSGRVLL